MGIVRQLQHWLGGSGPRIHVSNFVPSDHDLRLWADTFPWAQMVEAVERSMVRRFPKESAAGRWPVSTRVLLALELLKAELNCSDLPAQCPALQAGEQICSRLRTDFALMYACGIQEVQADVHQGHFVLPEVLCQFRSRLDEALMEELLQIQATAALDAGLVSPQHLVVDTYASEQGSQRVTDATTLYKAKKKSSPSSKKLRRNSTKSR